MSQETITFQIDSDKQKALDELAVSLDKDRSYILNEAIDYYLEMHRSQIEKINQAIAEANTRDFANDEEGKVFSELREKYFFLSLTKADLNS